MCTVQWNISRLCTQMFRWVRNGNEEKVHILNTHKIWSKAEKVLATMMAALKIVAVASPDLGWPNIMTILPTLVVQYYTRQHYCLLHHWRLLDTQTIPLCITNIFTHYWWGSSILHNISSQIPFQEIHKLCGPVLSLVLPCATTDRGASYNNNNQVRHLHLTLILHFIFI